MTDTRSREITWEDPLPGADLARTMSGLDYMRACLKGRVPRPPIAATMGFDFAQVEEGRVVFACTPGEHHYNPIGLVHGGLVSTLIDSCSGCAVHTTLARGLAYSTVNLSVDMLRPVSHQTGRLRAVGAVVHRGSRIAIASGEVIGEADDKIYARGQTTCLIFPIENGG